MFISRKPKNSSHHHEDSNRQGGIASWNNNRNNNNRNSSNSYKNKDKYNNRKGEYNNRENKSSSFRERGQYSKNSYQRNYDEQEGEVDDISAFGQEISQYTLTEILDEEGKNQIKTARSIMSYFRRVEGLINKDEFPTNEDRIQFITSVVNYTCELRNLFDTASDEDRDEIVKKGLVAFILTVNNPVIAKTLQTMIPLSSSEDIRSFLKACSSGFDIICNGKFSSFVIQEALKYVPDVVKEEASNAMLDDVEDNTNTIEDNTISTILNQIYYSKIDPNLFDMIFHKNASFVVRQLSLCLGNINAKEEGKTLLDIMVEKMISSCPIADVLSDNIALGFLTSLMENVSSTDSKLFTNIMRYAIGQDSNSELSVSTETISKLLSTPQHCHIVEVIINHGDEKTFSYILQHVILPNAESFATDQSKCYSLVNAIEKANRDQFISIFNSVKETIKKCFGNTLNVITALAKGCLKFNTKEQEILQQMMKGFEGEEHQTIEQSVMRLLFSSGDDKVMNRHGCNLLSTIFTFQSKKLLAPLVDVFKNMEESKFFDLCISKEGSMVIDSLVQSYDEFIQKIKPKLVELATNVYGAFIVEKAMTDCKDSKLHKEIATILKDAEQKIRSTKPGSILWNKTNLSQFKSNPNEWIQRKEEQRIQKKKTSKMMQEVLISSSTPSGSSKKKKNKKSKASEEPKAKVSEESHSPTNQESDQTLKVDRKQKSKQDKSEKPKKSEQVTSSDVNLDFLDFSKDKVSTQKPKQEEKKRKKDVTDLLDNIFESSLKKKK
ncbi:hypothetical protein C9374_003320 [Naegleria lovaniensis]|uniref:Uncharacterized protein n=1 Tax=Naegleria lovaniensis TaxID=51637 RepID=A0AA88GMM9_NAELO|nr:uncharacterized protein C9374_003320 [Naegleria lovaniensis]KAG2385505.1 hypothetical protein C9374_003320 [Naegleria lovaniensis]